MRGHLMLLREAELMASSPERVHAWLEARAASNGDEGDEELEQSLLARGDPLVDLALARFGQSDRVAHALFNRESALASPHARAIRLAALSNEGMNALRRLDGLPDCLFAADAERLSAWLASAPDDELAALFGNPAVNQGFLTAFFEGKAPWLAMSDERRMAAVRALCRNPRMQSRYSGDMDGYAEHMHNRVFDAAWKLAETLAPSREWSYALGWLLSVMPRKTHGLADPLLLADRWRPSADDVDSLKTEAGIAKSGHVWGYGLVRQSLASLRASNPAQRDALLASDDYAFRAAVYSLGRLTEEQIHAAYERDKNLAVGCCQENYWLWRDPKLREAVKDISWQACSFNNNYMDSANAFDHKSRAMRTEHPDWFEEAVELEASAIVASKADVEALSEAIENGHSLTREAMAASTNAARAILARLGWVWWFALGALAASLWHRY